MKAVLPLLIERATQARDQLALQARQAAQALQQSQATLAQLQRFREDYLQRAPGRGGQSASADQLQDGQRFVSRLDQAIALQQQDGELRRRLQDEAQQRLTEGQRRLMAFEALASRQAAEHARAQQRQAQRESDEHAARSARPPPFLKSRP